jgi:hypothetical protein
VRKMKKRKGMNEGERKWEGRGLKEEWPPAPGVFCKCCI